MDETARLHARISELTQDNERLRRRIRQFEAHLNFKAIEGAKARVAADRSVQSSRAASTNMQIEAT